MKTNKSNRMDSPPSPDDNDALWETVDEFEREKHSEELKSEWMENFDKNPSSFFDNETLEKLSQQTIGRRISLLARASLYVTVTPDMAKKYFEKFPADLESVAKLYTTYREGQPEDGLEFQLFSIVAPEVEKISTNFPYDSRKYLPEKNDFVESSQYLEIAARRNIAPQILLENGNFYVRTSFDKFGKKATDNFFGVLKEANDLSVHGDHFLKTDKMFGVDFEKLSESEKAEFLRMALVNIHHNMVAEEAYNSCFSKERVEDDKQRTLEQIKQHRMGPYNIAHSMIFKTYQATSVYESRQENFEYTMNHTADCGGFVEEYADHRIVLAILNKFKTVSADKGKNIDLLVDFWDKNRNPIFGNAVAEALNAQDVNLSAAKLLELLKKGAGDKNHISAILYRLEFGQVGISKKGVKYLEKMYNLGELNNPDYFAQRLTAKGDIGVFDDERVLQKYFNIGDLASEEAEITPQIHDFVYETLFRVKEGETPVERKEREKYLKEFKENYFGFYDDKFFKQTGIRFNNLDFREQGWFLLCYKNADEAKRESLVNFARQFGEQGLVSFLSLEYNDNNGDKILKINEKLDRRMVEKILARYVKIQANAQRLEETMKNSEFLDNREMDDNIKQKLRENVYDAIMSRATDILSTAYLIAQSGEARATFYTGKEIKVSDIGEVVEAMEIYEDFLEKLKGFFAKEGRYQFNHTGAIQLEELSMHNFLINNKETGEKSYCSVSLRGKGTNEHLKDFEYDGEARINFLFNNKPIPADIKNANRKEATTFRLDRECITFDKSGKNVIDKNNTKEDGRLSFDFGSIYEDSGRQNSTLGKVMSVGNYYVAHEKKKKPEYYHNKESFYRELGQADTFKEIVLTVEDFIKEKYQRRAKPDYASV